MRLFDTPAKRLERVIFALTGGAATTRALPSSRTTSPTTFYSPATKACARDASPVSTARSSGPSLLLLSAPRKKAIPKQ